MKINFVGSGKVARDAQTVGTSGKVATFTVAFSRGAKDTKTNEWVTDFITVRVIGKTEANASKCVSECKKGSIVNIVGHVCADNYTDRDGNKKTMFYILADSYEAFPKDGKTASDTPSAGDFMQIPDNANGEGLPFS